MKETVYIETSVVSYLCSRPSRDLIVAANQEVTREWWERDRARYDCYVSALVLEEVAADVAHIATVAVYGLDYLLTWNCAHIANPHWQPKVAAALLELGYAMPVVCTPQALLEGEGS